LIEIVTEPDLTSPAHARAFLALLKQTLEYIEVSDCDMEKGSLRVDANVSVRPTGTHALGTKTEVKNMNSFSNVERALTFEIERQTALLAAGGSVEHETLLWDAPRGEARPMRSKEESHDYRYFPDPDLPPLVIDQASIEKIRAALPELPAARRARFLTSYGLPEYDAGVLTASRSLADYYEAVVANASDAKAASNWVMTDVLGWVNQRGGDFAALRVPPAEVGTLIRMTREGALSSSMAREVFNEIAESGRGAAAIVQERGLVQVRDEDRLRTWAAEAVAAHPGEAERYRGGDNKLFAFFMGQVMKRSKGQADPRRTTELLRELLG
jgi:aspartyl-tRNA(Asn)/glutamyl-tRNA(Gln) amidotransferase subunit B